MCDFRKIIFRLIVLSSAFFIWIPTLLGQEEPSTPTKELHEYLLELHGKRDLPGDLDHVKELVEAGADIHAEPRTGGNSLNLAVESYAARSGGEFAEGLAEIVEYFLSGEKFPSPKLPDLRGLTPLYNLLRYGAQNDTSERIMNLLLEKGADVTVLDAEDYGLVHLLTLRNYAEQLTYLLDRGLPLYTRTKYGLTFAHQAARHTPKKGEALLLKRLFDRFVPEEARKEVPELSADDEQVKKEFAQLPTDDGHTPLHFAARFKNLAAVKYLVEEIKVHVNPRTIAGITPADIAKELGKDGADILSYLKSKGGGEKRKKKRKKYCDRQNPWIRSFSDVRKIIKRCKVKSVEDLLALMPKDYLGHRVVVYSRLGDEKAIPMLAERSGLPNLSVQSASPDFPQIVSFGEDGKMMMAFNGHPSQNGYRHVEFIQFHDKTKKFSLHDIEFPETPDGKVIFQKNPARCVACHGEDPRLLWDTWPLWPGKLKAEMESYFPYEFDIIERFRKNMDSDRYKHIAHNSLAPVKGFNMSYDLTIFQNLKMDRLVSNLMAQKIGRAIQNAKALKPFRYAALAALSCYDSIEEYIPPHFRKGFASYDDLLEDTKTKNTQELENRLALHREISGGPYGSYNILHELFGNYLSGVYGRNFDTDRTARLRYVVENNSVNMDNWFAPFNLGEPSYMAHYWNDLEAYLWQELLNPRADRDLHQAFSEAFEAKKGKGNIIGNLFYVRGSEEVSPVCQKLKIKSLKTLDKKRTDNRT